MIERCHICSSSRLVACPGTGAYWRVTSDCKPWPPGGALAFCEECRTVQTLVNAAWREDSRRIYSQYQVYHQAGGAEQAVFDLAGSGQTRSSRLVASLKRVAGLPESGRILDIGCGNGSFLRAFGQAFPGWELSGAEFDGKHLADLEALPAFQCLYTGGLSGIGEVFDLVVMVHTLEHIENPVGFLGEAASRLAPGGRLFVQVPHYRENPFELMTADHASHFDAGALRHVLRAAGLRPVEISTSWVEKELSALAIPCGTGSWDAEPGTSPGPAVEEGLRFLASLRESADSTRRAHRSFGIFGTSIAATWLAANLAAPPDFFVDEDATRIGRTHMDRPILAPSAVAAGAAVVVALPTAQANAVTQRLGKSHFLVL